MLMPKRNRNKIYEYLFKEGVIVAKKDFSGIKHPHVTDVPNLHVIKALQSLTSRAYVKEQFAWRHYYWSLTNEGIQYLRDYLHLPPEIVPATLKRQTRPEPARGPGGPGMGRGAMGYKDGSDRDSYRRGPGGGGGGGFDKQAEAGAGGASVEFRGGFGRGKPAE